MFNFQQVGISVKFLVRMCMKSVLFCSDFRHFCVMSEIWPVLFGFQKPYVSEKQTHIILDFKHLYCRHLNSGTYVFSYFNSITTYLNNVWHLGHSINWVNTFRPISVCVDLLFYITLLFKSSFKL